VRRRRRGASYRLRRSLGCGLIHRLVSARTYMLVGLLRFDPTAGCLPAGAMQNEYILAVQNDGVSARPGTAPYRTDELEPGVGDQSS
jgi:hypothetical protein